jgi:hypothetical protein
MDKDRLARIAARIAALPPDPAIGEESMRVIEQTIAKWKKARPDADEKVMVPGGYYMYFDPNAGGKTGVPNADDPVSLVRESDDEVVYSSDAIESFHTEDAYESMEYDARTGG